MKNPIWYKIKKVFFRIFHRQSYEDLLHFEHATRFFDHVNTNIQTCGKDTFDPNKKYYSIPVHNKTHWDFAEGWRPVINWDIRQWFEEHNITKYELRKSPERPDYPLKVPTMNMHIDFEELNDATLFKLTWCGSCKNEEE